MITGCGPVGRRPAIQGGASDEDLVAEHADSPFARLSHRAERHLNGIKRPDTEIHINGVDDGSMDLHYNAVVAINSYGPGGV